MNNSSNKERVNNSKISPGRGGRGGGPIHNYFTVYYLKKKTIFRLIKFGKNNFTAKIKAV